MALFVLFGLMLLVMLARVYLPLGVEVRGKVLYRANLSLVERYLLHRVNFYAIGAVLVLMTVTGNISNGFQLFIVIGAQVISLIPVRCVLTSEGVALNNVVFRSWSDFGSYRTSARRVTLIGREGSRSLNIPIVAEHQRDLVKILGRHLPRTYAGKEAPAENPVTVS